ncbi:hypothetical protein FRB97_005488 [Tulasnella sp. 331]|nr:hypothetical protein FRB97_005488 [Tulasnella sp. 331]
MRIMYLPIVLTCVGVVESTMIVVNDCLVQKRLDNPKSVAFLNDPVIAVLANDLFLNWYFTGMICYRLWSMDRQKRAVRALNGDVGPGDPVQSPYALVTRVLVQGGVLNSVTEAAFMITILMGLNDGRRILDSLNNRVMGIVAVLIMLQLNIAGKERDDRVNQSTVPTTLSIPVFLANGTTDSSTTNEVNIRESAHLDHPANAVISAARPQSADSHITLPYRAR